VAELLGLVLALSARYGPIRQIMLNSLTWEGRFRRLAVGARVVRVGWYTSLDPAVLIVTTDRGDQLDVLVVPPRTAETAAYNAMTRAADPANTTRAAGILAMMPVPSLAVMADGDADPIAMWDNEGGHLVEARAHRPVNARPVPVSS
jgi:hypothetical protein